MILGRRLAATPPRASPRGRPATAPGEILQHDPRDHEGDFLGDGFFGVPVGEVAHVLFADLLAVAVAQDGLQHDADAVRQARDRAHTRLLPRRAGCAGNRCGHRSRSQTSGGSGNRIRINGDSGTLIGTAPCLQPVIGLLSGSCNFGPRTNPEPCQEQSRGKSAHTKTGDIALLYRIRCQPTIPNQCNIPRSFTSSAATAFTVFRYIRAVAACAGLFTILSTCQRFQRRVRQFPGYATILPLVLVG